MTPKLQTLKNFCNCFESYMFRFQNDMLNLFLSLLEMEIQLIIHSTKIILNSLQNCRNPKSHTLSAFSEIWHKIYFHGIKKQEKLIQQDFLSDNSISLQVKKCHFTIENDIFCIFTKMAIRNLKFFTFSTLSIFQNVNTKRLA